MMRQDYPGNQKSFSSRYVPFEDGEPVDEILILSEVTL